MLGENLIRFLGLDRDRLRRIAERVGPSIEQITGRTREIDRRLIDNFQSRSGYLKPAEEIDRDKIDLLLREDMAYTGRGS